jgi:cytoskeletal protein RodZ
VAAGFRVRRVQSVQAIGDRLKRARTRKKITVAQVEEATKIRAKFILALESDSWEQIPSEVYGRGYLERYLQFLQLPDEEVMEQYDKERHSYARHCKDAQVDLAPKSHMKLPRLLITPRLFVIAAVLLGVGGVTSLVTRQIVRFTAAPALEIFAQQAQAKELSTSDLVVHSNSFTFKGKTAIGAAIRVNDQVVLVDPDGQFEATVPVQEGVNAVVVRAMLANGKETSETLSVTVQQ